MQDAPRQTGKWLRNDVPHTGWVCIEVTDDGDICEMCEVTEIVYAHIMRHEHYPLPLRCGCVCAGFMADDPATENLRELLYKWRRLQLLNRTPIENLRRKGWRSMRWRRGRWSGTGWRAGHVFGWTFGKGTVFDSPIESFSVEISNADGWRFHIYYGPGTRARELLTSEPFTTDLRAAMAGIEWAEMLMANEQWVASECEAVAEERAAQQAKRIADDLRYTIKQANEYGYADIAAEVEAGRTSTTGAWHLMRQRQAAAVTASKQIKP